MGGLAFEWSDGHGVIMPASFYSGQSNGRSVHKESLFAHELIMGGHSLTYEHLADRVGILAEDIAIVRGLVQSPCGKINVINFMTLTFYHPPPPPLTSQQDSKFYIQ